MVIIIATGRPASQSTQGLIVSLEDASIAGWVESEQPLGGTVRTLISANWLGSEGTIKALEGRDEGLEEEAPGFVLLLDDMTFTTERMCGY